jgi:hypothetical protein
MRISKKDFIIYLFTSLLIASGLLLILIPLNTLPQIRILTEEPAELSMIIEALHGASPAPQQIQRAAKILEIQRNSLTTLGSAAVDATRGLEYGGVFLLLSGVILLITGRERKNPSQLG